MAENKTRETDASVDAFLDGVANEQRREDCRAVVELMAEVSGEPAKMWGKSIIGFGTYHYRYESGREGDLMRVGVSPRARELTLYIMPGFSNYGDLMSRLGAHRTGKSCLYIKRLSDVDLDVLRTLIAASLEALSARWD